MISITLGEITDADKIMNPQHFGSDLAYIQIPIRINLDSNPGLLLVDVRRLGRCLRLLVICITSVIYNII